MCPGLSVALVYDDSIDRDGGIPLYVRTLGIGLQKRGHRVECLVGDSAIEEVDGLRVRSLARNVGVRFNGNSLSMPIWSRKRALEKALKVGCYDVIHVQVPYSPLMAGRLVRRADPGCAVIGTYHVASERLGPSFGALLLTLLELPSAPRFDEVFGVSPVASEFARRWSRMDVARVVPNMVDLAAISQASAKRAGAKFDVVFVGRLVKRKGLQELINAVGLLDQSRSRPTRMAIVGDGPLRQQLQHHVRCLGLDDRIIFMGRVDDQLKFAMLARARVACFPSLFGESFGVVILEALAAGAEVVLGGDNRGYRCLLDGEGLVDPRDTSAFADALRRLLDDGRVRRRLGARQRESLARYDAERVIDEVLDVYIEALRRRRNSGPVWEEVLLDATA
jgi:phosphatidyl-myo-inositol alpha-mannosyltransferase